MSLLLREKTDGILAKAGLPEFHAQVYNKNLQIVGACGAPVVTIKGIQFSRNAPSIREISYSVDLFEAFVNTHKVKLLEYRRMRQLERQELDNIDTLTQSIGIGSVMCYRDKVTICKVVVRLDTSRQELMYKVIEEMTAKEAIRVIKGVEKFETTILDLIANYRKREDITAKVASIRSELSKCYA